MAELQTVRVVGRREEAAGILSFELASPDGHDLPPFTAGAHIDVHIAAGLIRQYSLCNDPVERHRYVIAVLRDEGGRGGSIAMHEKVHVGQLLPISHPRNAFALNASTGHTLLMAGGIGITPLLAMAQSLSAARRDFTMHYCARNVERAAFLDRLAAADLAGRVHVHFDDGPADQRLDLRAILSMAPADTHLYVCGPTGFMDFVIAQAREALKEEAIHREYFSPPQDKPIEAGAAPFEIRLARSGKTFQVPAQETIAAVLIGNGIDIPLSCEQGICGTCLVRVIAGVPDHRDTYLSADEHARNEEMTLCCSRSYTPLLEIDL